MVSHKEAKKDAIFIKDSICERRSQTKVMGSFEIYFCFCTIVVVLINYTFTFCTIPIMGT
jgi:hypothetical protein